MEAPGDGLLPNFNTGRLCPEVQPLTLLYILFTYFPLFNPTFFCTLILKSPIGTNRDQEPITRSLHLPYKPYETTFAGIFLFLETVKLLDWHALCAIQYNITQYDTPQHNSAQNNTIQCTKQYAFFGN